MGSFDLQQRTRIEAMNRTKTPHPAFGHPLPIRWGEGMVRDRFMERDGVRGFRRFVRHRFHVTALMILEWRFGCGNLWPREFPA